MGASEGDRVGSSLLLTYIGAVSLVGKSTTGQAHHMGFGSDDGPGLAAINALPFPVERARPLPFFLSVDSGAFSVSVVPVECVYKRQQLYIVFFRFLQRSLLTGNTVVIFGVHSTTQLYIS